MKQSIALIVGGSSGIGLAVAKQLAKEHQVWLLGKNMQKLMRAKSDIEREIKTTVITHQTDLYRKDDVDHFIEIINQEKQPIKYLVNAAGYFKPLSFMSHSQDDYDRQMDINKSLFFITQAVANNMIENNGGNIVNIGSMWAHQAVKATPSSAYSMQKAGLHALTKQLAMELAEYAIRVNAVAPAVVETPIYEEFIEKDKVHDALQSFKELHPLNRIGTAEDITNAILFLLSDSSSWITGTVLNVDGGVMAGINHYQP